MRSDSPKLKLLYFFFSEVLILLILFFLMIGQGALAGVAMLVKMGVPPLHLWVLPIFSSIRPGAQIIYITTGKRVEVAALEIIQPGTHALFFLAVISFFFFGGMFRSVTHKIFFLSSINIFFFILGAHSSAPASFIIFTFYSLTLHQTINSVSRLNEADQKTLMFITGMPPSPGFFFKVLRLSLISSSGRS